jgi:glutamate formiminotransferase
VNLIECVPNFSEGRDRAVIDAIAARIEAVDGVMLLDVDPGAATNRTVMTFAGEPGPVERAAFAAIATAAELIDMTSHSGEHPRMGATDVCPFVPMEGSTMDDCVEIARRLGARVGDELGIPVYLYEYAAEGERRSLADVRSGEYEGLQTRQDQPDFGPSYNATAGATAIGARAFLIAYNINLNTTDRRLAHQVASAIRTMGAAQRDHDGTIRKDAEGKTIFTPGRFQEVKGLGWYIEEYGIAQVSLNLTDYHVTPIHAVFDACREEARERGMRVTGSELVGLVPLEAMLAAGDHYLRSQGVTTAVPEPDRVRAAVVSLGLDDLEPFDPSRKIVEYRFRGEGATLASMSLTAFTDELSSGTPTPGGGSAAALCGALGAALASMIAAVTHSTVGLESSRSEMEEVGAKAQILKDWFREAVDRDTDAYNAFMEAMRLPRTTDAESAARSAAMQEASLEATLVPLQMIEKAGDALDLILVVAKRGNPRTVSDAGVAGVAAAVAAEGASLNVRINLDDLEGDTIEIQARHDEALDRARRLAADVSDVVEAALTAG